MQPSIHKRFAKFRKQFREHWQLLLFLIPGITVLILFHYIPMYGVQIAFREYLPAEGILGSKWVGLEYFRKFLTSFQISRILPNTILLSLYMLVTGFPLTVLFALALNTVRDLRFKKLVQTVSYIPHFISTVVMVGMLMQMLSPVTGLYGNVYRLFGGSGYPKDLFGDGSMFRHLYVWSDLWQGLGWSTIVYIAALSSVDPELHEAAEIDGASRLARIRHIDFPAILPTVSVMLILTIGGILNIGFDKVYLMQNNLNLRQSEIIATYVYKVGMSAGDGQFSYATAIGLFNSVINCLLLIIVNAISRRIEGGATLW